ncbi:hypothetical protein L596_025472 [Steinernema carpocapsae]|uniref:OTU domain-containing protein n=1 Tax=Steinernema carpocapsae TaxID=34508 RepID=A0A4U5M7W4_STECR|nr:hypothetical protein L596_025472 [Steinernema carpocapsae]
MRMPSSFLVDQHLYNDAKLPETDENWEVERYELLKGLKPERDDAHQKIKEEQATYKAYYDRRHKPAVFKVGDMVRVTEITARKTVRLEGKPGTVSVDRLMAYEPKKRPEMASDLHPFAQKQAGDVQEAYEPVADLPIEQHEREIASVEHECLHASGNDDEIQILSFNSAKPKEVMITNTFPTIRWQQAAAARLKILEVVSSKAFRPGGVMVVPEYAKNYWFSTVQIQGDGNCGFRTLSWFISGSEKHYEVVRTAICDIIVDRPQKWIQGLTRLHNCPQKYLSESKMRQDRVWMTTVELQAAAEFFNCHIIVRMGKAWYRYNPDYHALQLRVHYPICATVDLFYRFFLKIVILSPLSMLTICYDSASDK